MRGHGPGMARYEDFEEYRDAPCRVIAVDFDGVLCKSAWPEIGAANSRIIAELRNRQMLGDKIMRTRRKTSIIRYRRLR